MDIKLTCLLALCSRTRLHLFASKLRPQAHTKYNGSSSKKPAQLSSSHTHKVLLLLLLHSFCRRRRSHTALFQSSQAAVRAEQAATAAAAAAALASAPLSALCRFAERAHCAAARTSLLAARCCFSPLSSIALCKLRGESTHLACATNCCRLLLLLVALAAPDVACASISLSLSLSRAFVAQQREPIVHPLDEHTHESIECRLAQ